eukprot:scaffold422323_cov37-Prasinocladus_malaysianus.AAC.1
MDGISHSIAGKYSCVIVVLARVTTNIDKTDTQAHSSSCPCNLGRHGAYFICPILHLLPVID